MVVVADVVVVVVVVVMIVWGVDVFRFSFSFPPLVVLLSPLLSTSTSASTSPVLPDTLPLPRKLLPSPLPLESLPVPNDEPAPESGCEDMERSVGPDPFEEEDDEEEEDDDFVEFNADPVSASLGLSRLLFEFSSVSAW